MFRKARIYCVTCLFLAVAFSAFAAEPLRIDGSSDEAANASFKRMVEQAPSEKRRELQVAMLLVVMDGVPSATAMLARPELRSPTIALVRERVNGMTADELIALSKTSTTKAGPSDH